MPKKKVKEKVKSGDRVGVIIMVVVAALAALFILAYLTPKPSTETVVSGVKVVSEIPMERFRQMEYIALYNQTATPAELTCKFELSAISKPEVRGYKISIGEGDYGIYLKEKEAYIKGRTEDEILTACHVFACLRDGIECPNFMVLGKFFENPPSMSVILDSSVGQTGGRGYAEIMGALSYVQSGRADLNKDGFVNQSEVDGNEFFIYPFIKEGDGCRTLPFNNLIQNWSSKNETVDCDKIAPSILLTLSNESAIRADGRQVVVSGSDDDIHTASIILRDVIAPDWIRRIYNMR